VETQADLLPMFQKGNIVQKPFDLEVLFEPTWIAIPVGGDSMKQFNQFAWVNLGQALAPLRSLSMRPNDDYVDYSVILLRALRWLNAVLYDSIVPLDTCKPAARKLEGEVREHQRYLENHQDPGARDMYVIGSQERMIDVYAGEFLTILNAELEKLSVYQVAKKRIYDTNDLIQHAHKLFSEVVIKRLPEAAKTDIDAAGRCLAFEVPTAAAFHILRASEAVMGLYYSVLTNGRTFKADKVMRNWGAYIEALRKHGAEKKVTEILDHIRAEYRNPITHPEDTLTLDEALDLFNAEVSSISQIISQVILKSPPEARETIER
jgi:hypothetical protein